MNQATEPAVEPDASAAAPGSTTRRWPGRALVFLPELVAVLCTLWVFRTVIVRGRLPGNLGDARWTIALHEHWYRVWTGQESIRDLFFYYPARNTLGSSDAFLVQGQLYSLARLLGVSPVDAWVVAGIGFFLIGALGVAALSRRVLDSRWLQVAFVVLCVCSYAMQVGFGHVQLFGMLSASWIFVGLHDLVGGRHVRRGVALLAVAPPLLALSSWYAMVLTGLILVFLGAALALLSSRRGIATAIRLVVADLWSTLRSGFGIAGAVLMVVLWAAVVWVYLPSMGLLPPPGWLDVQIYSPRWSDLWNASEGGGGIWSSLYTALHFDSSVNDQRYGFTPIVFVVFATAALGVLRVAVRRRPRPAVRPYPIGPAGLLAAVLAVVGVLALFLMDERGFSLFRVLWQLVPGMNSIRSPYRVMIILFGLVVLVVLRGFELWWNGRFAAGPAWRRAVTLGLAGVVTATMVVEMQRPVDAVWTRAELLSPALVGQIDRIRADCDALILLSADPATPAWLTSIDAVILAAESGVPTPQGYSRADPIGYPDQDSGVDPAALLRWMRDQGFDGRVCSVSAAGDLRQL